MNRLLKFFYEDPQVNPLVERLVTSAQDYFQEVIRGEARRKIYGFPSYVDQKEVGEDTDRGLYLAEMALLKDFEILNAYCQRVYGQSIPLEIAEGNNKTSRPYPSVIGNWATKFLFELYSRRKR